LQHETKFHLTKINNNLHMKSIGFKNFRRFDNFPSLELGEITLMVGGNNSGKSTLVKSILLTLDYLRTQQGDKMYFDKNTLNDVNIVTFGRARCNYTDSKEIIFDCTLDKFAITIVTKGEDDDTFANVMSLEIFKLLLFHLNWMTVRMMNLSNFRILKFKI
jgi:AAA15 family ATPase/GTPase